jgi:predicted Zn-dependent protease
MGLIIASSANDNFKDDRMDIAKAALSIGPSIATKSFFSFSRGSEYVADALAIDYLKKVKRNPKSLSIILEKLYGQELLLLERQDPFLRTHPLSKARMDLIKQKTLGNISFPESYFDKVSYLRIKAKLEGFLENPGKTLINNKDNSLHSIYARAIAYFRAPMYKKSMNEIDSLLKDYPNDPYFIELKAQILSENGKIKEAIKYYNKTLDIIPGSTLIMLSLSGLLLEENKNYQEIRRANNYLKFIVQKEPDNILAWHLKGISHNRLGESNLANLSAAEEFLRKRDHKNALYFAKKVISSTNKFSSENLRASDIINLLNEI